VGTLPAASLRLVALGNTAHKENIQMAVAGIGMVLENRDGHHGI